MIITSSYQELVIHLAEKATPEETLAFQVSEAAQTRAEELTERNKEGSLTAEERTELQQMLEFDEMMTLFKLKALKTNGNAPTYA